MLVLATIQYSFFLATRSKSKYVLIKPPLVNSKSSHYAGISLSVFLGFKKKYELWLWLWSRGIKKMLRNSKENWNVFSESLWSHNALTNWSSFFILHNTCQIEIGKLDVGQYFHLLYFLPKWLFFQSPIQ